MTSALFWTCNSFEKFRYVQNTRNKNRLKYSHLPTSSAPAYQHISATLTSSSLAASEKLSIKLFAIAKKV